MTRSDRGQSLSVMRVVSTSGEVQAFIRERELPGRPQCAVVPTMGALHAGHAALVERGSGLARQGGLSAGCIVTIFVNPTQFNDPSDFARYPRTLEADLEICRRAGASAVVVPGVEDVYPPGHSGTPLLLPSQATEPRLEDALRPGHFTGVCQVVARLFEMVRPAAAIFGEKDWQQLQVVSAMVRRDGPPIEIIGSPTVREVGGLALSSRNVFLSAADRERALRISRALRAAGAAPSIAAAEYMLREVLAAGGITPDYAVVRDAVSLLPIAGLAASEAGPGQCRALVAAKVGSVRLLDNMAWPRRERSGE